MDTTDHVLIVDDDRGIRELIAGYLEKNGMRVSLAANGRDLRNVLDDGAPDLIHRDRARPGDHQPDDGLHRARARSRCSTASCATTRMRGRTSRCTAAARSR